MTDGNTQVLGKMSGELERNHSDKQGAKTLWHYTDTFGAEGILRERSIRATHYSFLNDRSELILGQAIVRETMADLAAQHTGFVSHFFKRCLEYKTLDITKVFEEDGIYVISFCEDRGDGLTQWRAYGGDGAGYAIGFKNVLAGYTSEKLPNLTVVLVKITYDQRKFRQLVASELLEQARGIERYCRAHRGYQNELERHGLVLMHLRAAALAVRLKHQSFKDEQEWRLVVYPHGRHDAEGVSVIEHRPSSRGLIPYIALPLSESPTTIPLRGVRFGPAHDAERGVLGLRSFLASLGYKNASKLALRSSIPYRP